MATRVGFGPLARIDGPPPQPPMYGLIPAAAAPAAGIRIVDEASDYWINGAEVWPYVPGLPAIHDPCATTGAAASKGPGTALSSFPAFGAMTVYLTETCTMTSVGGVDRQAAFIARATQAFAAVESHAVAREFMLGEYLPDNPHLADGQGTFPSGNTATNITNGLALLEGEIANSGRLGVIHVSSAVAAAAGALFLVDRNTGILRTVNGTPVVNDGGYFDPASGPAGHTAGGGTAEWIYATGPVDIRRSEIFVVPDDVTQALDRAHNTITYRAERFYLVDWDTVVQAAVLVDRCKTTC